MTPLCAEIEIPACQIPGGWVVGGVSRLLDAWAPSPLLLRAPVFKYPTHTLKFSLEEGEQPDLRGGRKEVFRRVTKKSDKRVRLADSDLCFDCRHDSTGNVAHVLQNQIGVALWALEAFSWQDRWRDLIFIVHKQTPSYALRLFETLGMRVLATDGAVSAQHLRMEPRKFPLRAIAADKLRSHVVAIGLLSDSDTPDDPIFLSRRKRRTLENMSEIEPLLNAAGFRTVYAEDLPVEKQIATVARARSIFGLHGAALGFMMLRDPGVRGVVVEAFSCGYATNWARAICSRSGDSWIGGQGELNPKIIAGVVGGGHAREHESSNYRLHPESVRVLIGASELGGEMCRKINADQIVDLGAAVEIRIA